MYVGQRDECAFCCKEFKREDQILVDMELDLAFCKSGPGSTCVKTYLALIFPKQYPGKILNLIFMEY